MQHKCENCNNIFQIERHIRRENECSKHYLDIKPQTGLNMVYKGDMNREYAVCPECSMLETQISAEARDQAPL